MPISRDLAKKSRLSQARSICQHLQILPIFGTTNSRTQTAPNDREITTTYSVVHGADGARRGDRGATGLSAPCSRLTTQREKARDKKQIEKNLESIRRRVYDKRNRRSRIDSD
jgi:hypothetical protein